MDCDFTLSGTKTMSSLCFIQELQDETCSVVILYLELERCDVKNIYGASKYSFIHCIIGQLLDHWNHC